MNQQENYKGLKTKHFSPGNEISKLLLNLRILSSSTWLNPTMILNEHETFASVPSEG